MKKIVLLILKYVCTKTLYKYGRDLQNFKIIEMSNFFLLSS